MLQADDEKVVRTYWDKSKQKPFECPWCSRRKIFLWKSHARKFKRYSIGCLQCYCAGNRALTEKGAVRKWNHLCKQMKKNLGVSPILMKEDWLWRLWMRLYFICAVIGAIYLIITPCLK